MLLAQLANVTSLDRFEDKIYFSNQIKTHQANNC